MNHVKINISSIYILYKGGPQYFNTIKTYCLTINKTTNEIKIYITVYKGMHSIMYTLMGKIKHSTLICLCYRTTTRFHFSYSVCNLFQNFNCICVRINTKTKNEQILKEKRIKWYFRCLPVSLCT